MDKCFICNSKLIATGLGAGYARDSKNNKICYECCAKEDKKNLLNLSKKEKYILYLSGDYVTNWPGTLKFKVRLCPMFTKLLNLKTKPSQLSYF